MSGTERSDYFTQVLALALSNHPEKNYQLTFFNADVPKHRAFQLIAKKQGMDVIAGGATKQRADIVKPVLFPILRGAFGWRATIVTNRNRTLFSKVDDFKQFSQLRVGQMRNWSDSKILLANDLNLVAGTHFEGLYNMLAKDRFDHFPRSIIEIKGELKTRKHLAISMAPKVLIHYPTAYVFYVNKDNLELANDILTGLQIALQNGEFDALFQRHYGEQLNDFYQADQKIYQLKNPFLLDGLPPHTSNSWLRFPGRRIANSGS